MGAQEVTSFIHINQLPEKGEERKNMPAPEGSLKLTDAHKQNLLQLTKHFTASFPRDELIKRFEKLDEAYNMEVHKEVAKDAKKNKREDIEYSERFTETDLPIVRQQVQAEIPFMENIFLSDDPIFSVDRSSLNGDLEIAALGINAKIKQDSQVARWMLEMSDFILKGAKYNLAAMEVSWQTKSFFKKVRSGSSTELEESSVEWQGNSLKSLDPYNIFFDTSVPPHKLSDQGEFAGYVEKVSHTSLSSLVADLIVQQRDAEVPIYLDYGEDLWTSSLTSENSEFPYKEPSAVKENDVSKGGWATFSGDAGLNVNKEHEKKFGKSGTHYELLTVYLRFVPLSIGIKVSEVEEENFIPQIWKLYIVGGRHILAAVPANNSHNLLPIAVAKPDLDNLGLKSKSSVECTINVQKLAGEFLQRRIASIDRNIGDSAIFDPKYIDGSAFTKRVPDRKVPVKSSFGVSGKALNQVYMPLPFTDSTNGLLSQEIPFLMELAQGTNLTNNSRYGKFQKGNKTPDEFRATLANSEAPLLRRALQMELQAFYFVKVMLQHNYVDYGQLEGIEQPDGTTIEFDPATLLSTVIKFRLAGGLDPLAIAMKSGELATIFEMAQTVPIINQRYDLLKIFEDTFYARGLDLTKYAVPLEQQVAEENAGTPTEQGGGNPPIQ